MNNNDTKHYQRIAIIYIVLFLIGFAIFCIIRLNDNHEQTNNNQVATPTDGAAGITIRESNTEESPSPSYIAIPGFSNMTFISNTNVQQVDLFNPETNTVRMDMKIGLLDGTQIWEYKGIEPGDRLTEITLSAIPPVGVYDAVLIIDCYLPDGTKVNGGIVQFQLNLI